MPRITGGSLAEHRAQIHQRVFAAFADLLAERSFDAITMAQIAAGAEVGRTTIYHHFPDKESVVVAFATHETSRYLQRLEEVLAQAPDPAARLRAYVHHHLASGEEFHLGLGPRLYGVLPAESREAIREHVVAVEGVLREVLDDGQRAGLFTVDDLDATLALIHACLAPRGLAPESVATFVLRAVSAP